MPCLWGTSLLLVVSNQNMRTGRLLRVTTVVVLLAGPASGCFCIEAPAEDTFSQADAVFVGTVKSMEADFDLWDPSVRKLLTRFFADGSPQALAEFKRRYLTVIPEPVRDEVAHATNRDQLNAAFGKLSGPKWITLKVRQVFKGVDRSSKLIKLSTSFLDCGIHFAKGETYLVYAFKDAAGLATGACSRTRPISKAEDDLAGLRSR